MEPDKKAARLRVAITLAVVAIAAAIIFFTPLRDYLAPAEIRGRLEAIAGNWWAPLVFILLYCCATTFFIPPATALSLAAGVIWGWWIGGLWVLAASTVASMIPYLIGRTGGGWLSSRIPGAAKDLYRKLQNEGFITLLLLRLVPVVPYGALNYASGLALISVRDYFLATAIGTIPGIFIFTYLSDSIAAGAISGGQAFVRILIAGALLAALVLISRLLAARVKRRIE